jgi:hypothetical protein
LNGIPFDPTKIQREGLWCVHQFAQQLDAMMFWDRFKGRWMRGEEFFFPERPANMKRRESFGMKPQTCGVESIRGSLALRGNRCLACA